MKVKICGLTNLPDARWAWQCGADFLGFIFVRSSPRYIRPETVAEITETLTQEGSQARFVGVFANEPIELVQQTVALCSLHIVQLHGDESPEYVHALGLPAIVARRVRDPFVWDEWKRYHAWAYLLDTFDPTKLGGTGQPWPWEVLLHAKERPARLMIAGGLTPDNVAQAIRQLKPWGVDVSSGVEASPGRKDWAKVHRFIQCVRAETSKISDFSESQGCGSESL